MVHFFYNERKIIVIFAINIESIITVIVKFSITIIIGNIFARFFKMEYFLMM